MIQKGKVYLVGASSGDPDLLTIKAHKIILQADVILYDALVSEVIVNLNQKAEKIFVGKRLGFKAMNQQEINKLIVECSLKNKTVIRLKGGDPMVFGRAHEEISHCLEHQIECEVIPGISSYAGIVAQHRIPITKRNELESFIVTTGFTTNGEISKDIFQAAQFSTTVIVFMGIHNLYKIIEVFKQHQSENYPVAIIQSGTTKDEKSVFGNLETIENLVKIHQIQSPALIIFGKAVADEIVVK